MMQILDVVIYSYRHDKGFQKISFLLDQVNLVIGPNDAGKSSVGRIIEYCLGADYNMPPGHLDERVAWYGIRVQMGEQQFFIARKHKRIPPAHQTMYFKIGNPVTIPNYIEHPNSTKEAVIRTISGQLGILPELELPWPSFENPTNAGVVETLPFCFQYQSEIQSESFLFHNAIGQYTRTVTKYILPYLLGAIPDKKVKQRFQLLSLEKQIKTLQKKLDDMAIVKNSGSTLTRKIILEGKALKILGDAESVNQQEKYEDTIEILRKIAEWNPTKVKPDIKNDLAVLQQKSVELREQMNKLDKQIDIVSSFIDDYVDYEKRIKHQESHLKPIHLFKELNGESKKCPLCSNELNSTVPISDAIKNSVKELQTQLENIHDQTSSTVSVLEKLNSERDTLNEKIIENYAQIETLLNQKSQNRQQFDDDMRRSRISAKAEFLLDVVRTNEDVDLSQEISEKQYLKDTISREVNFNLILRNTESILREVNEFINQKSGILDLERKNHFVGYDPERQRFFYEEDNHQHPIHTMSGESLLGYHIITLLGLHKYFSEHKRPVPNFLFFDQPSQVYYSSKEGDPDSKKTNRLYNFILSIEEQKFVQLIITDHANLEEVNPKFKKHIRRKFTESDKFVPEDWPKYNQV